MNDMFLIGMTDEEIQVAIEAKDHSTLSRHLYRVQKLSSMYYVFRYHLETEVKDEKNDAGEIPKFYRIRSLKRYQELNACKVKIDLLGRILLV